MGHRAQSLTAFTSLPGFSGGSLSLGKPAKRGPDTDSMGSLMELSEDLVTWIGRGMTGIGGLRALLEAAEDSVDSILAGEHVAESSVDRCLDLKVILVAWLENACAHSFRPMKSDVETVQAFICDRCDLQVETTPWDGMTLVLATCDYCGEEMDRDPRGRTRRFHSLKCRVAAHRERLRAA